MSDSAELEKLLEAGWVTPRGNGYVLTPTGQAALRRGIPGRQYGPEYLPVDTVRARAKPSIRKKEKRRG